MVYREFHWEFHQRGQVYILLEVNCDGQQPYCCIHLFFEQINFAGKEKKYEIRGGGRAFLFCQNGLQYESICLKASAENETIEKTWSTCFFEIWLQKRIIYLNHKLFIEKSCLLKREVAK